MKEEYKTQLIEALSEETKLIKETEDKLKMNLNFIQLQVIIPNIVLSVFFTFSIN